MAQITTKRLGAGAYEVRLGERAVTVLRNSEISGEAKWIAAAQWDRWLLTDPLLTKRDAIRNAIAMIREG